MTVAQTLIPKRSVSLRDFLVSVWGWLLILTCLVASFFLQCIVLVVTYPFVTPAQRSKLLGQAFRGACLPVVGCNPFWTTKIHGQLPVTLPDRLLVMSNHVSDLDPFLVSYTLFPHEAKYIAKGSLFSVPFGGWAMRLAGDIPIHFTSEKGGWGVKKGSIAVMMEECRRIVTQDHLPIMVYPEGTRDGTLEMKPFKPGMFQFAADNQCHILTLAISGAEKAWPFPGPFTSPATINIAIGEIIPPCDDAEKLREAVRGKIETLLHTLPPFTNSNTTNSNNNSGKAN